MIECLTQGFEALVTVADLQTENTESE